MRLNRTPGLEPRLQPPDRSAGADRSCELCGGHHSGSGKAFDEPSHPKPQSVLSVATDPAESRKKAKRDKWVWWPPIVTEARQRIRITRPRQMRQKWPPQPTPSQHSIGTNKTGDHSSMVRLPSAIFLEEPFQEEYLNSPIPNHIGKLNKVNVFVGPNSTGKSIFLRHLLV